MATISHMLWFDKQAEEAAQFYVSVFPDASITNISRGTDGSAFTVEFDLLGAHYIALNGGPLFTFSEAFSRIWQVFSTTRSASLGDGASP